jgi:hypothetical protein
LFTSRVALVSDRVFLLILHRTANSSPELGQGTNPALSLASHSPSWLQWFLFGKVIVPSDQPLMTEEEARSLLQKALPTTRQATPSNSMDLSIYLLSSALGGIGASAFAHIHSMLRTIPNAKLVRRLSSTHFLSGGSSPHSSSLPVDHVAALYGAMAAEGNEGPRPLVFHVLWYRISYSYGFDDQVLANTMGCLGLHAKIESQLSVRQQELGLPGPCDLKDDVERIIEQIAKGELGPLSLFCTESIPAKEQEASAAHPLLDDSSIDAISVALHETVLFMKSVINNWLSRLVGQGADLVPTVYVTGDSAAKLLCKVLKKECAVSQKAAHVVAVARAREDRSFNAPRANELANSVIRSERPYLNLDPGTRKSMFCNRIKKKQSAMYPAIVFVADLVELGIAKLLNDEVTQAVAKSDSNSPVQLPDDVDDALGNEMEASSKLWDEAVAAGAETMVDVIDVDAMMEVDRSTQATLVDVDVLVEADRSTQAPLANRKRSPAQTFQASPKKSGQKIRIFSRDSVVFESVDGEVLVDQSSPEQYVNRRMCKRFDYYDGKLYYGTVKSVRKKPALNGIHKVYLFYIVYDDKDSEEMLPHQLAEAFELYKAKHLDPEEGDVLEDSACIGLDTNGETGA